jgi:pyruvate formate lyase activating enzyme
LNDTDEELGWVAKYLVDAVGPDTPWHISRFYGQYLMADTPSTPTRVLERAYELGKQAGLRYVYVGNLPGNQAESTFCPGCGTRLIERVGYRVARRNLRGASCAKCGTPIAGVGLG